MTTHVVKSFSKLNQQKRKAETPGTRICQVLLFSRVEINISDQRVVVSKTDTLPEDTAESCSPHSADIGNRTLPR